MPYDLDLSAAVDLDDLLLTLPEWTGTYTVADLSALINCIIGTEMNLGRGALDMNVFATVVTPEFAGRLARGGSRSFTVVSPDRAWVFVGTKVAGGTGNTTCDGPDDVPVRGTFRIKHRHPGGQSASDFHFYMYQNDKPHVQVSGATASSDAFSNVDMARDSNDNRNNPPNQGPPYHGSQVNFSGGSVADGEVIEVAVMLCMNERNNLKFSDVMWTYPNQAPRKAGAVRKGGWRVKRPQPGGNGGNTDDPGGGGSGAQAGGGGSGAFIHWVCIENDDDEPIQLDELKLLASMTPYADLTSIDWTDVDPVKNARNEPPVQIPAGERWCYPFQTTGNYVGGHVYLLINGERALEGNRRSKTGEPIASIGDHPVNEEADDLDLDLMDSAFEDIFVLDDTDDGTHDPDNGHDGNPDGDPFTNGEEQGMLSDPRDPSSPDYLPHGLDTYRLAEPFTVDIGSALPPLPADFFFPGSQPFNGLVPFDTLPLAEGGCGNPPVLTCNPGTADTLVRRLDDLPFDPLLPTGGFVDIQLEALSLASTSPITVTDGGGGTHLYDVCMTLSENQVSQGQMGIVRRHLNGGVFHMDGVLFPQLIFTDPLDPDAPPLVFDGPTEGFASDFSVTGVPFNFQAPHLSCPGCAGPFVCGIQAGIPTSLTIQTGMGDDLILVASCATPNPPPEHIPPGCSLFSTPSAALHFGSAHVPPIPADFFGPGSEPFEGMVRLVGSPLGEAPDCPGDIGTTDTLICRSAAMALEQPGDSTTIPIEMVALQLQSSAPITIGGTGTQWDVAVSLSAAGPSAGFLTAERTHPGGGLFHADLTVLPRISFTQVGAPSQIVTLDPGVPIHMRLDESSWSSVDENFNIPCPTGFIPGGVSQMILQ